nr:HAMP domain-containing sensor histidine kinase [Helicobacter pametensis]
MLSSNLLDTLTSDDKEVLLTTLGELIGQIDGAQQEFSALKSLFEGVLEMLPQAVWVLQENGEFFYFNSKAYAISKILEENLPLDDSMEVEFEGSFYLLQGSLIGDKRILTATDITHQKRQERLVTMGQISAHLAHEIRNPVGSISLLASSLLKRVDVGSKGIVYEIKKAIWRVENIIKTTLMFSKGVSAQRDDYLMSEIKDQTQEILNYISSSKPYAIEFDAPDEAFVWCDLNLLVIVLQNFLSNAIDAIEEGECEEGKIKIGFSEDGECYFFSINDNGRPIQDPKALFEPFKTTKLKGTGLGLTLSRQIIRAHDGEISLMPDLKTFVLRIAKRK